MKKERPKELGYLFVVGGPGGSGSSTISKMLAQHFNLTRINAGEMFRDLVRDFGYGELPGMYTALPMEDIYEFDRVVDERMIRESQRSDVLIEAKAFAALSAKKEIPCTVKIWITANERVRTVRTVNKEGYVKNPLDFIAKALKVYKHLRERVASDRRRYRDLYGIDYNKPKKYNDIVIDSSNQNIDETYNLILKKLENGGYLKK